MRAESGRARRRRMIWGMTTSTFTELHVALSLVGMATGLIVMIGLLRGRGLEGWTAIFLLSLAATSVTGFAFPVEHLLTSHTVGAVSLLVLAVAALARYGYRLRGAWRSIYVVAAAAALYLDVLVAVALRPNRALWLIAGGHAPPRGPKARGRLSRRARAA